MVSPKQKTGFDPADPASRLIPEMPHPDAGSGVRPVAFSHAEPVDDPALSWLDQQLASDLPLDDLADFDLLRIGDEEDEVERRTTVPPPPPRTGA
jgi:hypothetical protein